MNDAALLLILLGFAGLAWLRPWLGVPGLMVLAVMHPQGYADGFMRGMPVYLTLFAWVCLSVAYHHARRGAWRALPWQRLADWRILGLGLLWLWFGVTSLFSVAPWEAWPKYLDTLKILPPIVLMLLLIDTRAKFQVVLAVMALSILLVAVKGGYWATLTGFQDRVYGPPGSPYGDNNGFAVAVAMVIPLLLLWLLEARQRATRLVLALALAAAYAAALASWSRSGMLALVAASLVMVWYSSRKLLVVPLLLVLLALIYVQLPDPWFGRMATLADPGADASAQYRLTVWRLGLEFVAQHPLTGGGFNVWPAITLGEGRGLDWHSAYLEVLTEHGYVGLLLWLGLLLGTLFGLARRVPTAPGRRAHTGGMLQAALAAYLVGALTLGIAYWVLPYYLVALAAMHRALAAAPQAGARIAAATGGQVSEDFTLSSAAGEKRG